MVIGMWLGAGMGLAAEAPSTAFPCQNGWAQCRKQGETLDGRPLFDGAGMPNPADARLGWFDLDPTPTFDPFDVASDDGVALALIDLEAVRALDEGEPAPRVVPALRVVEPAPSTASATHPVRPVEAPRTVVAPQPVEAPVRTVERKPETATCGSPASYEAWAEAGRLDTFQTGCLEETLRSGGRMRVRIHASLALIADAAARGETAVWAERTAAHLENLDRSDARLARSYASWAEGHGRPLEAIRWTEVALENRHQWTGEAHVQATEDLYATRARAANTLWLAASSAWQADPTTDAAHTERAARNRAKSFARAWLDYVRAADRPVQQALALCASTAGTAAYCSE